MSGEGLWRPRSGSSMRESLLRLAAFVATLGGGVLAAAALRGESVHVAAVLLAVAMGLPLGVGPAVAVLRALRDAPSAGDDPGGNRPRRRRGLPALQLLGLPPWPRWARRGIPRACRDS